MDVKYQIFVSSTFEDLRDERRGVIEAILNLGHIPVGMELFQANDDTQWNYIKRRISECDYYVLIVAERYGSEQDGKSYTQMEYEYAIEHSIPVVAFLLSTDARKTWPRQRVEFDKQEKVEAFRQICQQKLIKLWNTADDLALKVTQTLFEMTRENPGIGWVRADTVPSPQVYEELARLSEEKRELQARVSQLSGNTALTVPSDVAHRLTEMQMTFFNQYVEGYDIEDDIPTLLEVFLASYKRLALGCEIFELWQHLQNSFPRIHGQYYQANDVLREFSANNLVDFTFSTDLGENVVKVFKLTTYGKDFVMYAYKYFVDVEAVKGSGQTSFP